MERRGEERKGVDEKGREKESSRGKGSEDRRGSNNPTPFFFACVLFFPVEGKEIYMACDSFVVVRHLDRSRKRNAHANRTLNLKKSAAAQPMTTTEQHLCCTLSTR